MDAAMKIVKNEGAAALWSGVTPTIARNGTSLHECPPPHTHILIYTQRNTKSAGIQQATMFFFKAKIDEHVWGKDASDPDKKLEVWQSMTSGLLASCPGM